MLVHHFLELNDLHLPAIWFDFLDDIDLFSEVVSSNVSLLPRSIFLQEGIAILDGLLALLQFLHELDQIFDIFIDKDAGVAQTFNWGAKSLFELGYLDFFSYYCGDIDGVCILME